ncbi:MAG: acyl carrier protein [Bacteroidetes bacterium]|nr:acyl carrier protein [Bacteroidota bacterium]
MDIKKTEDIRKEIKLLILETLNIKNVQPEQVDDSLPLFSKENILNLDSIDGIELIMAIQKKYDVRIADQNLARNVLESVNSIAEFVIRETNPKHELLN